MTTQSIFAQTRSCSTAERHQEKIENDPVYKDKFKQKLTRLAAEAEKEKALCANPVVYPVAVHFQVSGLTESDRPCLEQLAQSQIDILNNDYQGTNADISTWINTAAASFPGLTYGEACIEFSLAVRNHPTGYGISDGDIAVTILQNTGDNDNSWDGYINIYVRAGTGVLGYSPLGGDGDGDGVVVDAGAFGAGAGCNGVVPGAPYNLGRTLTHELGHYFLLNHIWGGGCGNDDGVADTPDSDDPYYGCPNVGVSSCGSTDMHMNYMDYVNDACMYMFSDGQADRMENYGNGNLVNVINNGPNVLGPTTPSITFEKSGFSVTEGSGNCNEGNTQIVTVNMKISSASTADADINLYLGGEAIENEDFYLSESSLYFPAGTSDDQSFDIIITEDKKIETVERIEITYALNSNGGDAIEGNSNQIFTLTLIDDDFAPSVSNTGNGELINQNWEGSHDWTFDDSGQNSWVVGSGANLTNTSAYISRNGGTHSYRASQTSLSQLISPIIDATGYTNLTLDFDYICEGEIGQSGTIYDYGSLYYSTNGNDWILFSNEYFNVASPSSETISLPIEAENSPSLQIAFRWQNDESVRNDPPLAVDNIILSGDFDAGSSVQTDLNSSSGYSEAELGPFETVHFYDMNTGDVMLTIENESNHNYGCTRVEVDRSGTMSMTSTASEAGEVTEKTFFVSPDNNNNTGIYTITLYYTGEEIDGWVNNSGFPVEDLRILKSSNPIDESTNVEVVPPTIENFGDDYTYSANFTSGFSGFALGNALIGLAVDLLDFEAKTDKASIQLSWITNSEEDNKGFYLERSTDPTKDFENLTWVDGLGDAQSIQNYQFIDRNVKSGVLYYYRLKQVDHDGTSSYSKIINAKITGAITNIEINPNPIKDVMNIQFTGKDKLDGNLVITDVLGKTIKSIPYQGNEYLEMEVNLNDLTNGVYFMQVFDKDQFVDVRKFVKTK